MAEAAVLAAVETLGDLVISKAVFLQGVEDQVRWLKNELERMQCFLKDAAVKQAGNERIRKWISDIREVAQDANDVMETFILKVDTPRKCKGSFERWLHKPSHLYHLNTAGKEIESIKTRLKEIERSRGIYGIQNLGEGMDSSSEGRVEWRRQLSPWQKDKDIVGLKEDVDLLLQKSILDKRKGLSIATIVGMGGIGKSTLGKELYNHTAVCDGFECRAWVCVSSDFNPKEIIKGLLQQLVMSNQQREIMEQSELTHLKRMLHELLQGRRYFVVIDDVWEDAHWESLEDAFPDEDTGSRLLLTSRKGDIAKHARYVHEMKSLGPDESWELLMKKAFVDNTEGKCRIDLESLGREILRKCYGLPLAINMTGGLLVDRNPSTSKWEKVLKEINIHLTTQEGTVSQILELSYRNLSPELKACFLSLGFFKEDATIRAKKLVHVWIAQGLIQQERGEAKMEEIGLSYLDELINRNLIQVKDMGAMENIKNCHVHDLLRELSITKAKEEISFEILREDGNSQSLDKPRHRSVYGCTESFIFSARINKHLRSLFLYGTGESVYVNPSYWKSFELLRILDLEDNKLSHVPDTIGGLIGLRYLGLRHTWIRELPDSFGRLENLEVLDISRNGDMKMPDVIWKMGSLRHLYMHPDTDRKEPLKIDTLKNLQTLDTIKARHLMPEDLVQLTNLRKLRIILGSVPDIYVSQLFRSLEGLNCFTHFVLLGKLTKLPSVMNFPPNLSCLSLCGSHLHEDPMPVLEKLPKLSALKLERAYEGEEMVISNEGFWSLKLLALRDMYRLKTINVGEGGRLPVLKRLEISNCQNLVGLPEELRSMAIIMKR